MYCTKYTKSECLYLFEIYKSFFLMYLLIELITKPSLKLNSLERFFFSSVSTLVLHAPIRELPSHTYFYIVMHALQVKLFINFRVIDY